MRVKDQCILKFYVSMDDTKRVDVLQGDAYLLEHFLGSFLIEIVVLMDLSEPFEQCLAFHQLHHNRLSLCVIKDIQHLYYEWVVLPAQCAHDLYLT